MSKFTKFSDIIDLRDVIARFEELEAELENLRELIVDAEDGGNAKAIDEAKSALGTWKEGDEGGEFDLLRQMLSDCKGMGGDEEWCGDWYPVMLIRYSHFTDYAQELAEDCGMIQKDAKWPYTCIDWDHAARQLLMDYSTVSFDGVNYHCR